MKKEIITTADGSHTVAIPEMNVTYHSHHGAVQESKHVFIEAGLRYLLNCFTERPNPLRIFEMGFGTGLNAFLTAIEAAQLQAPIHYTAVERFPLAAQEVALLNYPVEVDYPELFAAVHQSRWNEDVRLNEYFTLHKQESNLLHFSTSQPVNLIYYDAFAPSAQPELWTQAIFEKLFAMLEPNGVLVTYCSKGEVRRAMQAAGFVVEKLLGPKGKREIVRATANKPANTE